MNHISPALQSSYRTTMRTLVILALAALALFAAVLFSSCTSLTVPGVKLPIELGVRYQVEPGIFLVANQKADNSFDVKLDGKGDFNRYLSFDGEAYLFTSPLTGIVYRISKGVTGRPRIEIVGSGTGKLKLVTATPPPTAPVLTEAK